MMRVGAVRGGASTWPSARLDLRFIEVDGTWQQAGPLRFRAVEVEHVPYLRCFGYLFDRGGADGRLFSGDTTPCDGPHELARRGRRPRARVQRRHTPPVPRHATWTRRRCEPSRRPTPACTSC